MTTVITNPSFEDGADGQADNWVQEGISPLGDTGVGSGAIDPGAWWAVPDGTKVNVLSAIDEASKIGHLVDRSSSLGSGDDTYTGSISRTGWPSYVIPGTVVVSVGGTPVGSDDGLGEITGTGISGSSIDYFTGEYELTITGTGGAEVTLAAQERLPGYHRTQHNDPMVSPRSSQFLRFYRKVEVPSSPAIPEGTVFTREVLLGQEVVWSHSAQAGDEGTSEEGRIVVARPPLPSGPRIRDTFRLSTGKGDTLFFDADRSCLEDFRKFSEYTQVEPDVDDLPLLFDAESAQMEQFAHWHAVTQPTATAEMLVDPLEWTDWPRFASFSTAIGSGVVASRGGEIALAKGENQPAQLHTVGASPLLWHNRVLYVGGVQAMGYISGNVMLYTEGAAVGVGEVAPGGDGDPAEFGGFINPFGVNDSFAYGVEDEPDHVYGVTLFWAVSPGEPQTVELWAGASLGHPDAFYWVGHYLYTVDEPNVVHMLQTESGSTADRIAGVSLAPPGEGAPGSQVTYSPATGPGGSWSGKIFAG